MKPLFRTIAERYVRYMVVPDFNADSDCRKNERQDYEAGEILDVADDLLVEQIIENITNTPIGQVLKRIASMPEVRKEKVIGVRSQLSKGRYELKERLDVALDRVLEELII